MKKAPKMNDKAVYTTKNELLYFLHFLDFSDVEGTVYLHDILQNILLLKNESEYKEEDTNPIIQEFLRHDTSFLLADKYLIAMVFIYFKRAQLTTEDYTYLNFFAGLCLAHSMEEDIELSSEIYPWALGNELKSELPRLLELKALLWMAMDYRAAVSRHCCKQLISVSANHSVWQRKRSPFRLKYFLSTEPQSDVIVPFSTMKDEVEGKARQKSKKCLLASKEVY